MLRKIKYWWQRRTRGWDDSGTWNLDYEFMLWLNSRFKKYLEQADKIVDLDYYKFTYKGVEYTQKQLISKIIELTDKYKEIKAEDWLDERTIDMVNITLDLFRLLYWYMWW